MRKEIKQLRDNPTKKLVKELVEKREELGKLRFDWYLQKLKNTSQIGKTRKEIARISTVLNQKIREDEEQ